MSNYAIKNLNEILEDASAFFNNASIERLDKLDKFGGHGVYAIYYDGDNSAYENVVGYNDSSAVSLPVYIGKAVPRGWRDGRTEKKKICSLYSRIQEHARSIAGVSDLDVKDFYVRSMSFDSSSEGIISSVEAKLIHKYMPLWNTVVDGFGNHDPGKGRYNQARSEWDTIHTGRVWAYKLKDNKNSARKILGKINGHTLIINK